MRLCKRTLLVMTLLLSLAFLGVQPTAADVGPPWNPPGANIEPGSTVATQVRMVDERVVIDLASPGEPPIDQMGDIARVTATFHMRNLSSEAEHMDVRFPLEDESVLMSGSPITNFTAAVDGKVAEIAYAQEPFPHSSYGDMLFNWAKFPVDFPPGANVTIEVSYQLLPSFGAADANFYNYTLITGRDWNGTIGRAEIVVNLPYPISEDNVFDQPEGSRVSGTQLTWIKNDFEPDKADNFSIILVPPSLWIPLAEARTAVKNRPGDAQAWTALGNAYLPLVQNINQEVFQAAFKPKKNDWYVDQGTQAYQKAAELAPNSRRPHIGMAYLQLAKYLPQIPADQVDAIQAELTTAYSLPEAADPESAKLDADLLERASRSFGYHTRQYIKPGASATPSQTALPEPTATSALQPTSTAAPNATLTGTPSVPAIQATAMKVSAVLVTETPAATTAAQAPERSQGGWLIPGLLGIGVLLIAGLGVWIRFSARR